MSLKAKPPQLHRELTPQQSSDSASHQDVSAQHPPGSALLRGLLATDTVLPLQRTLGNQAVNRLLAGAAPRLIQRVKLKRYFGVWQEGEDAPDALDTATITDPLQLFDLIIEVGKDNPKLANRIWDDYRRAFRSTIQETPRVMRLDMRLQPIGRGTVLKIDERGCLVRYAKKKDPNPEKRADHSVTNYKFAVDEPFLLRPLRDDEQENDEDAYKAGDSALQPEAFQLAETTLQIIELLHLPKKVGKQIESGGVPDPQVVRLLYQLDQLDWHTRKTEGRTVYIQEGNWFAAEGVFQEFFKPSGNPSGTDDEADRYWQTSFHGITAILREESSATQSINATIELQIGKHYCEYKWAKSAAAHHAELGRVEHWDPHAPIEQIRRILVEILFAKGQPPDHETTRQHVGGSSGLREVAQFASFETFSTSEFAQTYFKSRALQHFQELELPEDIKLLFVNRNFTGSRIETGNTYKLEEMEQGLAKINELESYLTNKIQTTEDSERDRYQKQLDQLEQLSKDFGQTKPGTGMTADIKLLSIQSLFWERFKAMGEQQQIEMINSSLNQTSVLAQPLEQAASLAYVYGQQEDSAEPGSQVNIGGYTFQIGSRHAYKFHEQSVTSHPGLGGTQKEIELAIMKEALHRHLAGALPRSGAVGGISESQNAVVVNGVRIVYLAWSPDPRSKRIFISDYMASPNQASASGVDRDSFEGKLSLHLDTLIDEAKLSQALQTLRANMKDVHAPKVLLTPIAKLIRACTLLNMNACGETLQGVVLPLFGHIPNLILTNISDVAYRSPELRLQALKTCHAVAPIYIPELVAEMVFRLFDHHSLKDLMLATLEVLGGSSSLPTLIIETFGFHINRIAGRAGFDTFFAQIGLSSHPAVRNFFDR